jgi:hypothetical protein
MCLTCGCMLPHDDHGNPDYLTIEDLETSAAADSMGLDQAVRNLVAGRAPGRIFSTAWWTPDSIHRRPDPHLHEPPHRLIKDVVGVVR